MDVTVVKDKGLKTRWLQLHNRKTTLLKQAEQYAAWTLPYMFPPENNSPEIELPVEIDSIGAQGVNHLSNKIASTLFPSKSLFFRLKIDQETKDLIARAIQVANNGMLDPDDLKSQLEQRMLDAEDLLIAAEKRAEDRLNFVKYRPEAINAIKLLIITGNALVFHPEGGLPVQVYNFRNYHVVRDCSGMPVEMMTLEKKAFSTFHPDVQAKLRANQAWRAMHQDGKNYDPIKNGYEDFTEVCIYTQILLQDDGKWHVTQYADDVMLDNTAVYTRKSLRWIPLTWNLIQGEDYGRSLIADFAGAFHAMLIHEKALLNIAAVMGDTKFFVKPTSMIDVMAVQNSLPGSYHSGDPQDIGTPQVNKVNDAQFIGTQIEMYRRQLSQAFMLVSQNVRDAERVTAEEVRINADELEASNGGIYSRLAADWQTPTAYLALEDTGFDGIGDGIEPAIITGMDSLSRAGEAYNMRLFMTDLAMLNSVPEDVRMGIKKPQFIKQIASFHQVDYQAWVMTPNELAAAQQQEQQNQMALQQQQQEGQASLEAAKQIGKETQ